MGLLFDNPSVVPTYSLTNRCIRATILDCIIGVAPVFSLVLRVGMPSPPHLGCVSAASSAESHVLLLVRCFLFSLLMSSVYGVFFAFLTSSQASAVLRRACFAQGHGPDTRRRGTGIKRDNHVNSCSDLT